MMIGYAAMQSMVMVEGSKTGMAQGELQGAITSLQTICSVFAPKVWSIIYEWDVRRGSPGQGLCLGLAAVGALRLVMSVCMQMEIKIEKDASSVGSEAD